MTVVRAQVSIPRDTSLPEDISVNTWHFRMTGDFALEADMEPVHTQLVNFYNAIDQNLSPVNHNPCNIKYYDLSHAQPRSPIKTTDMTLTYPTSISTVLPEEVAMCLSYRGALQSGTAAARRRGRIYLGPLAANCATIAAGRIHISPTVMAEVVAAAGVLRSASAAATTWKWVVYSPTADAAGATPDAAATDVVGGWMDNVFDTQRRRGPAATARTNWT